LLVSKAQCSRWKVKDSGKRKTRGEKKEEENKGEEKKAEEKKGEE
jgi:hypothetical protein